MKKHYSSPTTEIVRLNTDPLAGKDIPIGPGPATSDDAMAKPSTGFDDDQTAEDSQTIWED